MLLPAQMTDETAILDSFLFQRRGFLSKDSRPEWDWDYFPQEKRLTGLNFELLPDSDGTRSLRVRYKVLKAQDHTKMDYVVRLDSRPNATGERTYFLCPNKTVGGGSCETRCRFLYLEPGGDLFVCRECSGIDYESNVRNHDPVYVGLWKPLDTRE